ncbi:hypothetical protein [Nocardia sp. NPDC127526]|uniref:hypothetical protein n=1 Tax=Nocardia sp. NPDC127526 TaxID=3345393 RepID=UPI003637182E
MPQPSARGTQFTAALAHIAHEFDLAPEPGHRLKVAEQISLESHGLRLHVTPRDQVGK